MNKPSKPTNQPSKPITSDNPLSVRVAALLNTAVTLGAAVLVAAIPATKKPPLAGD